MNLQYSSCKVKEIIPSLQFNKRPTYKVGAILIITTHILAPWPRGLRNDAWNSYYGKLRCCYLR